MYTNFRNYSTAIFFELVLPTQPTSNDFQEIRTRNFKISRNYQHHTIIYNVIIQMNLQDFKVLKLQTKIPSHKFKVYSPLIRKKIKNDARPTYCTV